MRVHHGIGEIKHNDTPDSDADPSRDSYCHILVGDVVDSKILNYIVRYIGPELVCKVANCTHHPEEETIEFCWGDLSLLS